MIISDQLGEPMKKTYKADFKPTIVKFVTINYYTAVIPRFSKRFVVENNVNFCSHLGMLILNGKKGEEAA
jgi:hypothetical protein